MVFEGVVRGADVTGETTRLVKGHASGGECMTCMLDGPISHGSEPRGWARLGQLGLDKKGPKTQKSQDKKNSRTKMK